MNTVFDSSRQPQFNKSDTSSQSDSETDVNFWQRLPRPIVGLAPMDGVTDQPFRQIVNRFSSPDVTITEFTNVEGLCHGAKQLLQNLIYDQTQRPIVAQIYGKTPRFFRQVAVLVAQLGFDGIDINMGCPSKSVAGGGAGAALIQTPKLAQQIIQAVQQGMKDWVDGKNCTDCEDLRPKVCQYVEQLQHPKSRQLLPVSLKTRTGYDQPAIDNWLPVLAEMQPAAIILHGRTLKQGYSGQADWGLIGQAASLVKEISPNTIFLGNGDVQHRVHAQQLCSQYRLDGALIGREARGNPFVFLPTKKYQEWQQLPQSQQAHQLAITALTHARVYEDIFLKSQLQPPLRNYLFLPMRKHLAWYISSVPHAAQIRKELVRTDSAGQVKQILLRWKLLPTN